MRLLTTILLWQIWCTPCLGQATKEQAFTNMVKQVVVAFSKHDSATIAKFINKKIGLYQLDKMGIFPHYNHFHTLSFSDPTYPQVLFKGAKGVKLLAFKYEKLPTWDCDKEVWSKKGLFVDTARTDHLLSEICKIRNKNKGTSIPKKTIWYFYDLENKSRRVVLVDHKGKELVFYLTYLNGKWFLTIVDNVSSDCSV